MNVEAPDLKQLSAEALRDLLNNLTQAKGFVLEQAPEFCQQLIARGLWLNAATGGAMVLAALALISFACVCAAIGLKEARRGTLEIRDSVMMPCCIGGVLSLIAGVPLLVGGLQYGREALSVYIAPKVFLVEEITRMLK